MVDLVYKRTETEEIRPRISERGGGKQKGKVKEITTDVRGATE